MEIDSASNPILESVQRAYNAFLEMKSTPSAVRSQAVAAIAKGLENSFNEILEANTLDLEMSREMAVPELMVDWLKLTPERLETTVNVLRRLARLSDPIGKLRHTPYQLEPSQTYCQLMPLGTVAFVYEAFSDLAAIAAGMCLKTGNSIILRGDSTASNSNNVIARVMQNAIEEFEELPIGCLQAISSDLGSSVRDLLVCDRYINLVIPYGRPSLVKQVAEQATSPVLRTAIGNCYMYWTFSGDLELARWMILDSHDSEPDPVNAIEKVLIDINKKPAFLTRLFNSLKENGFQLRGDRGLSEEFPEYLKPVNEAEWYKPYLDKTIAFKVVNNLSEAIATMNKYSSSHANCIVTESYEESRQFTQHVDSALVYVNASPKFSRKPNRGESVFLGISNQKGNRRGLIGLESLTTLKQVVQGEGIL
ncbi:MAG: glutamate-5-semialdehyde dehydrogenase [Xenococcaceae cyanobacterium]